MVLNILPVLKSFSPAPNLTPNTYVVCRIKVYSTSNAWLHVCVYIKNTQTYLILHLFFFLTFLCFFCSVPLSLFKCIVLWYWTLSASASLDFCSVFRVLSESCGLLYRVFVMHMRTLCRLTFFYLHESCLECFLSVFCFLRYGLNTICDAFVCFVDRWLPNSDTLHDFPVNTVIVNT